MPHIWQVYLKWDAPGESYCALIIYLDLRNKIWEDFASFPKYSGGDF